MLKENGNGVLRKILEAACEAAGVAQRALTVISRGDPYRLDTDANHRNATWIAELLDRFYGPTKQTHWRGLHYSIIMSKKKVTKPDGKVFANTEEDWIWLSEKAGKAARWLGYVSFDRIIDKRSSEPIIHHRKKVEPESELLIELDINIPQPEDLEPTPYTDAFVARQAFHFAIFGEKASLEEICRPFAEEHEADLYLGPGEMSDTMLWRVAKDAVDDDRPLVLFTVTDCDPSGWQMFISIARKLQALRDLQFPDLRWEIVQVALTPDQVRELGLPEEPIKKGDKRAAAWEQAFGVKQTEIDALTTPEMVQRGVLRQMLDAAIAPYLDPTLTSRVKEAEGEWYAEAVNAVEEQIDEETREELREKAAAKLEELREEIDRINRRLRLSSEHVTLPDIEVPESEVDIDTLDEERQAVIRFDTDWITATKILIVRKKYIENGEDDE